MAAFGEIAEVVKCQKTSPYMKLLGLLKRIREEPFIGT